MTEKNLKSMNRAELIEEMQALMRENDELGERVERLQAQLKESKARAAGREIARGITNYDAGELKKLIGRKSGEIMEILGYKDYDEAVHRDNLIIME